MSKKRGCFFVLCLCALLMMPQWALAESVAIDEANFPDAIFRGYVQESFDTNGDGELSEAECAAVELISVSDMKISSLEGLEYFPSLKRLFCFKNRLTSLDVSQNAALELLYCYNNYLTSLDVSQNAALEMLMCEENSLTSLDVSQNAALEVLTCNFNHLTSLDVSQNAALDMFECNVQCITRTAEQRNGLWTVDLSAFVPAQYLSGVTLSEESVGQYNPATGLWTCSDVEPEVFVYIVDTGYSYPMEVEVTLELSSASSGLNPEDGYYYVDGEPALDFTGMVNFNGGRFLIVNGKLSVETNGLALVNDSWLFFAQGQQQVQHTGFALYDGEWFYLENGALDLNANGLYDYDGGTFLIAVGRLVVEYTGLYQDVNDWYYIENGQVATWFSGEVEYDGAMFQVVNGNVVF